MLSRRRFPGWVRRRKTQPGLSTIIVELPSVDVVLPRDWEPTVKLDRRGLEESLTFPLLVLSVVVLAMATMVSS
jgi:hypothetical protein